VSLYIPQKDNMNKVTEMLVSELSGAAGIKSKQTRTSVCTAINSAKEKLKLYKAIPVNGLILFCGVIEIGDGKSEKKIAIDIEPYKQINTFAYRCQTTFYTEPLNSILEDDEKFGFIIVDGNGVLYATL
jgi:peptide chain release factor subunit 1